MFKITTSAPSGSNFFRVVMENKNCKVTLNYAGTDYPQRFAEHTPDPGLLTLLCKPLAAGYPTITAVFGSQPADHPFFGIGPAEYRNTFELKELDRRLEMLDRAEADMREIYAIILQYFPNAFPENFVACPLND